MALQKASPLRFPPQLTEANQSRGVDLTMHETGEMTLEGLGLVANLIDVAKADPLYSDLYLRRARVYLQAVMSREELRILKQEQMTLANLPNQIRNAMRQEDWSRVRELTRQHKILKTTLGEKQATSELAQAVYERHDVFIDPFSPGMHAIAGVPLERLDELRQTTVSRLRALSRADREWQRFYEGRLEVMAAMGPKSLTAADERRPAAGVLEEEAAAALENGNFEKLERLAGDLLRSSAGVPAVQPGHKAAGPAAAPQGYFRSFSPATVQRAAELGLRPYRAPSRQAEFAPLCRMAWHPAFAQTDKNHSGVVRVPDISLPEGVPETLKSRMQLFAMHPFINSAGIRFLPTMVGEDALAEDFAEPERGSAIPGSKLLELLALPRRDQLSRTQIETALQERGIVVLKDEFGLDPVEFRLVCIPPDLHLRIGLELGWGQQQIWTHFDGYMVMADGKLQALAGGDVRFGGIYDLLGLPLNYQSERLIARFAVVQRQRMATWS